MSLEDLTGTSKLIGDLDSANPTGIDVKSQGDDHIRGIKNVLKNTFPNITEAVTKTAAQLNAPSIPVGTKMLFYQAAAPDGWTQDTSKNDYMMRIVSGSGGGSGGSDSPILNNKVPSHTHTTNTTGAHTHNQLSIAHNISTSTGSNHYSNTNSNALATSSAGSHSHTVNANPGAANWTPKYIDAIICTKDAI